MDFLSELFSRSCSFTNCLHLSIVNEVMEIIKELAVLDFPETGFLTKTGLGTLVEQKGI